MSPYFLPIYSKSSGAVRLKAFAPAMGGGTLIRGVVLAINKMAGHDGIAARANEIHLSHEGLDVA